MVPVPLLLHQWLVEMLRRFNLRFAPFDAERLAQLPVDNPLKVNSRCCSPLDLFTANGRCAHRRWRQAGTWWRGRGTPPALVPESAGRTTQLVEALARASAGLLLLTATPEQIGQASHFARLRLLDPSSSTTWTCLPGVRSGSTAAGANWWTPSKAGAARGPAGRAGPDCPAPRLIEQILDRHGTGRVLFTIPARRRRFSAIGYCTAIHCPFRSNTAIATTPPWRITPYPERAHR